MQKVKVKANARTKALIVTYEIGVKQSGGLTTKLNKVMQIKGWCQPPSVKIERKIAMPSVKIKCNPLDMISK